MPVSPEFRGVADRAGKLPRRPKRVNSGRRRGRMPGRQGLDPRRIPLPHRRRSGV